MRKCSHCQKILSMNIASKHYWWTLRWQGSKGIHYLRREEKMFTLPGNVSEEHWQEMLSKNIASEIFGEHFCDKAASGSIIWCKKRKCSHCQETLSKNIASKYFWWTLLWQSSKWIHYLVVRSLCWDVKKRKCSHCQQTLLLNIVVTGCASGSIIWCKITLLRRCFRPPSGAEPNGS